MKKKIMTLALALLGLVGAVAAQAQTDDSAKGKCNKEQRAPGDNNKMRQPQTFQEIAFEGILLDVNQQARMDSLNQAIEAQRQQRMEERGPRGERPDSVGPRQRPERGARPDSIGPRGPRPEGGEGPQARPNSRRQYIEQVKQILTPEQYTTFLENIVFMTVDQPQMGRQMQGPRERGDFRGPHNMKGPKGHKGPKDAPKEDSAE
ncbi:MAG: hypothetical protein LUD17_03840 [Bacteroidales bacterium]|nr:hypothetical protein [Bacteroidales bacterium]